MNAGGSNLTILRFPFFLVISIGINWLFLQKQLQRLSTKTINIPNERHVNLFVHLKKDMTLKSIIANIWYDLIGRTFCPTMPASTMIYFVPFSSSNPYAGLSQHDASLHNPGFINKLYNSFAKFNFNRFRNAFLPYKDRHLYLVD